MSAPVLKPTLVNPQLTAESSLATQNAPQIAPMPANVPLQGMSQQQQHVPVAMPVQQQMSQLGAPMMQQSPVPQIHAIPQLHTKPNISQADEQMKKCAELKSAVLSQQPVPVLPVVPPPQPSVTVAPLLPTTNGTDEVKKPEHVVPQHAVPTPAPVAPPVTAPVQSLPPAVAQVATAPALQAPQASSNNHQAAPQQQQQQQPKPPAVTPPKPPVKTDSPVKVDLTTTPPEKKVEKAVEEKSVKAEAAKDTVAVTTPPAPPTATITPPTKPSNKRKRGVQAVKEESESSSDAPSAGEERAKRNRTRTQPYQVPLAPSDMGWSPRPQRGSSPDDKVIMNEFLAVRNEDNGFFVCRAARNIYRQSKKIGIHWYSQGIKHPVEATPDKTATPTPAASVASSTETDTKKEETEATDTAAESKSAEAKELESEKEAKEPAAAVTNDSDLYSPDFCDKIEFDCIITNLAMERVTKDKFRLPAHELERCQKILKRAIDVEKGSAKPAAWEVATNSPSKVKSRSRLRQPAAKKETESDDDEEESEDESDEDPPTPPPQRRK
ncbi:hypothetical protein B566_EDAN011920, partial [Ephemera danica]